MPQKYLNFDLDVKRADEGFRATVIASPAGEASVTFAVPFTTLEIENLRLKVARNRTPTRGAAPGGDAAKAFGERLFSAVFSGDVQRRFSASLQQADQEGAGLRLRLNGSTDLSDVPWEYLYSPELDRFLSLSSKTPIVRHVPGATIIPPLAVTPPLRMLVMVADPTDYPRLDAEREWSNLRRAIGEAEQKGLVAIDRVEGGSLAALQSRLRRTPFHVLHFVGHGLYDEASGQGTVVFESAGGNGRPMRGQELGTLLGDYGSLRLIVLNACDAGRSGPGDPFAGVAQALVRQQIPAVVAMQNEISDDAAVTFSKEFYGSLADGASLDVALVESRRALYGDGYPLEWGTPVLYTLSADGQIFDIRARDTSGGTATIVPPPPTPDEAVEEPDDDPITVEEVRPIAFVAPQERSQATDRRYGAYFWAPTALVALVFIVNWAETWLETRLTSTLSNQAMTAASTMRWIELNLEFQNPGSPASWSLSTAVGMWVAIYGYSIAYFLVFPLLGLLVALTLMGNQRREAYRVYATALAIDYALSLVFFLFFPVPERWAIPESGAVLLSDLWTPNLIKAIRWISALDNCFPSSHVSMTVVTIIVSYVYELRLRAVVASLGAVVILSTFVLGIHWIPDMIAGAAVATISVWAAKRLERSYRPAMGEPRPIG
jgi:membrane-associated phospholipid phosphatase